MGPQRGTTNDLATLSDLDDQGLVEELRSRYARSLIYTYIGDILVTVNPYTVIPNLYGDEVGHAYGQAKTLGELRPHVYALGSRAYQSVQRNEGNQCLLVSGESGSGKTEITKMLIAQIVRMSQTDGEYFLQDKIIEVNPLLEAFGNATTVINDNSSRFGKLIELIFTESGEIIGAQITEHMLEKSRIVRQSPGEKNFHIFYNLMCGFTEDERKRYFLEAPERYRIIDPGHGDPVIRSEIDFAGYKDAMENLRRIMPIVGFSHQDMDVVFALLAAILHLCNIEMAIEPESDEVIVMNEDEIDFAAVLLSVKAEDLISVLLANVNWVRGERIVYIKSLSQAVSGRDSLAMSIYTKLFSWIVQQVNFMLHEDEQRAGERFTISILDMAGFENFQYNSLEQLCINAANERLQHYFNEHIFALELQEYQQEGIKPPKIKFSNNTELLNLLFQRPIGLFSLLEEECIPAKTTDMTLIDKWNKQFVKSDIYRKSKLREPVFAITHYAGLRPIGLFSLLEEECMLAKTTDMTLIDKWNKQFVKSDIYRKSKHREPVFAITHYAGLRPIGLFSLLEEECMLAKTTDMTLIDKWNKQFVKSDIYRKSKHGNPVFAITHYAGHRPIGLFSLLEEECMLAKMTDMTLIDKWNKQFVKSDIYRKSKHREPVFAITHYAGLVTYHAIGFLGKNRDMLSTNMQSLMENSQNNLVNELFTARVSDAGTLDMRNGSSRNSWQKPAFRTPQKRQYAPGDSLSRQAGRKLRQKLHERFQDIPLTDRPNSVSAHFKNSLQMLVDKLKGSEPHFIRCIKPNHQKLPGVFDPRIVMEQLKSTGVLETVKIRRLGYAVRLPFDVFLKRYKFLAFPLTYHIEPSPNACLQIIKSAKLQDVHIGNTKVFLKYWHCDQLNLLLDKLLKSINQIQAHLRAYLARQQYLRLCRISIRDADDLLQFSRFVSSYGDLKYRDLLVQVEHDTKRNMQTRQTRSEVQNGHNQEPNGAIYQDENQHLPDVFSPKTRTKSESFYKFIVDQVLHKFHELDPDVWCKIFYMEYDRPVAKFYICDKEVIVDASMEDFSGKLIGLGVFNNPNRDDIVTQIRGFIGKGLRLSKEPDGSITATRLGKNDIIVKGYQNPANHCLSAEGLRLTKEPDGSITATRLGKNDIIVKGYQNPANHCLSAEGLRLTKEPDGSITATRLGKTDIIVKGYQNPANHCLSAEGLRLTKEPDGSITATRLGKNDIIVKGYQNPANHCLSAEGLRLSKEADGSITATRLGKNDIIVKGYQNPANHCLSAEGLRLTKEPDGSITATRLGKNDIIVKGYQNPANHCLSAEVIKCEGVLPSNQPVKIFDMDELKSHIGIAMRSPTKDEDLTLLSICGVSFLEDNINDLETPCWLCIINLVALETIDNPDVKREMLQKFVDLKYKDSNQAEERAKMQESAERHSRNWSKLNLRQTGQNKKEPLRKQRLQIKQKGDKVQDIMEYSWEGEEYDSRNKPMNLTELQNFEKLDISESVYGGKSRSAVPTRADSLASSAMFMNENSPYSPRKDWAKIKNTIKQETTQEAETQQKSKTPNSK